MGWVDPELPASTAQFLDPPLFGRLLDILSVAVSANTTKNATKHVSLCLQSILGSCSMSDSFMTAFCVHPEVPGIFENLLLNDPRAAVRQNTALLIRQKTVTVAEGERYGRSRSLLFLPLLDCMGSENCSFKAPQPRLLPSRNLESSSGP